MCVRSLHHDYYRKGIVQRSQEGNRNFLCFFLRLRSCYTSPTGRLEAGAPSAIEVVGTRYASPTGRLEAGAPSAIEVVGTHNASPTGRLEAGAPSTIEVVPICKKWPNAIVASLLPPWFPLIRARAAHPLYGACRFTTQVNSAGFIERREGDFVLRPSPARSFGSAATLAGTDAEHVQLRNLREVRW